MKKSTIVSFCGIFTALAVALLYIGSLIWAIANIMVIFSAFIVEIAYKSLGLKSSLIIYFATSILSLFILPDKESALLFALFFGYYPVLKIYLGKFKSSFVRIILKFVIFNITIVIAEMLCVYVFMIPLDNNFGMLGLIILLLLANVVFVLYDRLFIMFDIIWDKKLKKILNNIIKK